MVDLDRQRKRKLLSFVCGRKTKDEVQISLATEDVCGLVTQLSVWNRKE